MQNIWKGMTTIFRRMFVIATYLGVLLSLFAIHRYLLLGDGSLASHIGFSFLNAWALAKVILVGQELRIGDNFRNKTLVYAIVVKSAIFAVLLLVFRIIEEAVIGAVEGKDLHEAIFSGHPGLEHDKFEGIALTCIIMFFALMPFFAYLEFERVLGDRRMRNLIFGGPDENYFQNEGGSAESSGHKSYVHRGAEATESDLQDIVRLGDSPIAPDVDQVIAPEYQEQWFYEREGDVVGPVSERELIHRFRLGDISPSTLVYNSSLDEGWRLLNETTLV